MQKPVVLKKPTVHVQYTAVHLTGIQKDIKFQNKNSQTKTQNNAF